MQSDGPLLLHTTSGGDGCDGEGGGGVHPQGEESALISSNHADRWRIWRLPRISRKALTGTWEGKESDYSAEIA